MKITLDLTRGQVQMLRELIDAAPIVEYAGLIANVLPQLPLESDAVVHPSADSAPAPLESREVAGGFRLSAYTPRGVSMLDSLERVLAPFKPECSVCRREHGPEIVHASE